MIPVRITNGFNKLSDANLLAKTVGIQTAMTGNVNFPTPNPTLTQLATAMSDFQTAIGAAGSGNRTDIADKKAKKTALITMLHNLGSYVVYTAQGDLDKAKTSAFDFVKPSTPSLPLGKPSNLALQDGMNAGEVLATFDKAESARNYLCQTTPEPLTEQSVWQSQNSTVTKVLLTGLPSGQKYWFRIAALGIDGQLVYSDAMSRIVQ